MDKLIFLLLLIVVSLIFSLFINWILVLFEFVFVKGWFLLILFFKLSEIVFIGCVWLLWKNCFILGKFLKWECRLFKCSIFISFVILLF